MTDTYSPDTEAARPLARAIHRLSAGLAWLVLHPYRQPSPRTPSLLGLPQRNVRLRGNGVDLAAWHIPHPTSRAGIVLCHGHNGCRDRFTRLLRPLHEAGFHVLLFDQRAHGQSGGSLCTYAHEEQHDVVAAAEWLRAETGIERLGLLGVSMGGAAALLAAETARADAVVTDCAFARMEDMVEQNFFYLPQPVREPVSRSVRYWATRWCGDVIGSVHPEAAVRSWEGRPLLVIHGERDLLVPKEHGRRLHRAGGPNAEWWLVPGAHHARCLGKARREYTDRVSRFFSRHLLQPG